MIRRHFFLAIAITVVLLMGLGAAWKLTLGKKEGGPGGGPPGAGAPGAQAQAGRGPGGPGGAGRGGRGGRGGANVTAIAIQTRTFTDRLPVLGVAKGRESVTLTSNTAEMIDALHFRPGDNVRKGQVLVDLRRTEEDAGVLQAKSNLELARVNLERWKQLGEKGYAPKATVDQYNAAYDNAKAQLEAAQSRQGDRVIRAPFSGVIGLTDIAPGALISPGTAIATLDDISVIRVDFDIPDRFIALAKEGSPIVATTDSYPGERYVGRIAKLDTRIDERSRSIKARAEFPNPGGRLRPGMLMRVGVDRGIRQGLAAPEGGVQFTGGQAFVYKIGQRADGNFAQQQPVIVGSNDCGFIEIREGLQAGDRIIADGLNRIQPNQGITVIAGPGARGGRGARGPNDAPGAPGAKGPPGAAGAPAAASGPQAKGSPKAGEAPAGRGPGAGQTGGRRGPGGAQPQMVAGHSGCPSIQAANARGGMGGMNGRPGGAPGGRDGMPQGRGPAGAFNSARSGQAAAK